MLVQVKKCWVQETIAFSHCHMPLFLGFLWAAGMEAGPIRKEQLHVSSCTSSVCFSITHTKHE